MGDIVPLRDASAHLRAVASTHTAPPHDMDAERAVLAGVMIAEHGDPEHGCRAWDRWAWDAASAILSPEDFYHPAHATIWEAMRVVVERGEPLDIVTLCAELVSRERLETIGGRQAIGALTDFLPSPVHIATHAAIIARLARTRAMIDGARSFATRLQRGEEPFALRDRFVGYLSTLDPPRQTETRAADLLDGFAADLERAAEDGMGDHAVPTGLPALDGLLRMRPGHLVMLGALPGVGKTALALQVAAHAARDGNALFVTVECSPTELRDRLLSQCSSVPHARITERRPTEEDMPGLNHAAHEISALGLWIEEARSRQWTEVAGIVARHARKRPLRLVVIDHLHELRMRGCESIRVMTGELVSQARALAVRFGCPVLLLGALSRNMTADRLYRLPRVADFRETGVIDGVADTAVLLHWEHRHPTRSKGSARVPREERLVLIPKQRGAPTGDITLRFREHVQRFECVTRDDGNSSDTGGWNGDD